MIAIPCPKHAGTPLVGNLQPGHRLPCIFPSSTSLNLIPSSMGLFHLLQMFVRRFSLSTCISRFHHCGKPFFSINLMSFLWEYTVCDVVKWRSSVPHMTEKLFRTQPRSKWSNDKYLVKNGSLWPTLCYPFTIYILLTKQSSHLEHIQ